MFRCNHHPQGAHFLSLLKLRLLKQSIKMVNINFNTPLKKLVHRCENFNNIKMHGTTVKNKIYILLLLMIDILQPVQLINFL